MGRGLRLALLAVWLLPTTLPAQVRSRPPNPSQGQVRGHQPPSRRDAPARPSVPASQLPGSNWVREPDLFRARPSTYAPRYDRTFRRGTYWDRLNPGYGYPVYADPIETNEPGAQVEEVQHTHPVPEPSPRGREFEGAITPPAAPVVSPPLAAPRTFYVIPRCYAGDAPPRPEQLPPGCTVAALRIVPPRVFAR